MRNMQMDVRINARINVRMNMQMNMRMKTESEGDMKTFLARRSEEKTQLLSAHLQQVAALSGEFSKCEALSRLVGLLHDLGKAKEDFQRYLIDGGERGSVIHALQGGFFVDEMLGDSEEMADQLIKEMAALLIVAHHGSLGDGISPDGEAVFYQKLAKKEDERYGYREVKENLTMYFPELVREIHGLLPDAREEILGVRNRMRETYQSADSAQFALGLFVKHLFSSLIDADRLDAYLFAVKEPYRPSAVNWAPIIRVFEEKLQQFDGEREISKIRRRISERCKKSAEKDTGIYQLSVPTGGGKTLSSLRFALHHSALKNKKRIIYVIPYLSIIEQTASELRKILGVQEDDPTILECHSNIVPSEDKEEQALRALAASRWDQPIIITTMVQFLETVMSSKGGKLRKLHNLSDAVMIFDEIQSLPIHSIHLFNETVSFLAKICNTTVLLCTATQPSLDQTVRENLLLADSPALIDCSGLFDGLKRTRIVVEKERDVEGFSAFVSERAMACGDCLAIVNTRKSARAIFDRLKGMREEGFEVYHLSTSMCSLHRRRVIDDIRQSLKVHKKIICVTTQLIEAGVDISFSCVVRAAAGLDSVTQAAGRCNRHGESREPRAVYLISLKDENLDKLLEIKSGKEITERLIHENEGMDLSEPTIMAQFYRYYFYDKKGAMDYETDEGETVYEMLSCNQAGRGNYKNRTGFEAPCLIAQGFHTADLKYAVMDQHTEEVVVRYGESEALIAAYREQPEHVVTKGKLELIKKLEKFSVSLYPWELEALTGAIDPLDEETGIRILDKMHYSKDIGVVFETDPINYII